MMIFVLLLVSTFGRIIDDIIQASNKPLCHYNGECRDLEKDNLDLRVSKCIHSRGYSKVRVSVISQHSDAPSGLDWDISGKKFEYRWDKNYYSSTVIDAIPGGVKEITIDGKKVNIELPKDNGGSRGIIFADICIEYHQWCKHTEQFQVEARSIEFLNEVMKKKNMHYWYIVGDALYDRHGSSTKRWFDKLSLDVKSKSHGIVLGNHEYWTHGRPSGGEAADDFGIGVSQWWAQDTPASLDDPKKMWNFKDPSGQEKSELPPIPVENTVWWHKMGNVGIIGYSSAHPMDQMKPYFDKACQEFSKENLAHVFLLAHWNAKNRGCKDGMDGPAALESLKSGSCSFIASNMHFVVGHNHKNEKLANGFSIGGNGMYSKGDGGGQFGHLYVTSDDKGNVSVWYFEFQSKHSDNWDKIISCIRSKDIDECTEFAEKWYHGGPDDDFKAPEETSSTPQSTPEEEDPDCMDLDEHSTCKTWAEDGQCESNPGYMLVRCKKSCDQCCEDVNPHCKHWGENGECEKNPEYMNGTCPKTCGTCPSARYEFF